MEPSVPSPLTRALAAGQGAYFLITGLWPLFSLKTFYAVTGPKRDGWLVQTVGAMIACIGTRCSSAPAGGPSPPRCDGSRRAARRR